MNTFLNTRLSALMTLSSCPMFWSLHYSIPQIPHFTHDSVSPCHDHWPMVKGISVLLLQNRSDNNDFASRCADLTCVGKKKHGRNGQLEKTPQKQLMWNGPTTVETEKRGMVQRGKKGQMGRRASVSKWNEGAVGGLLW